VEGVDREDHRSRPAWAKRFVEPYLNEKKLGKKVPNYIGKPKIGRSKARAKNETLKNTQSKSCRYGLNDSVCLASVEF
jgi:hypothetical protein